MSNLFIEISGTNDTKNYRIYDNIFEETAFANKGELYRALVKEYGGCTSKMYVDVCGKAVQIGWVFSKRVLYDDAKVKSVKGLSDKDRDNNSFICSTWISVHAEKPTVKTTYHYAKF